MPRYSCVWEHVSDFVAIEYLNDFYMPCIIVSQPFLCYLSRPRISFESVPLSTRSQLRLSRIPSLAALSHEAHSLSRSNPDE